MEKTVSCSELQSFKERDVDYIQLMICHGQRASDMSVFLYSVLDVQVCHGFFQNTLGELNIKNFQRFEKKTMSQSVTVLNTSVRVMEPTGYEQLRSLILVSCNLAKLTLSGLNNLELVDVRYNHLESIHESIKDCHNLKTLRISHNKIKRLPREIGALSKNLASIEAAHNGMRRLTSHIIKCHGLKFLQLNHNDILELPMDIGILADLEDLYIQNNKISQLPLSLSGLGNLKRIKFTANPLSNIPVDFPERAADVKEYLRSLQEDPVANKVVKLVLVGQEGVGKTTLLKAIKRTLWMLPRSPSTPKTEGIEVKDIIMDDMIYRCFDCGGDVDFNETHTFFITQGALYLACFNLSEFTNVTVERNSFLLGRLQLWLQYIYSKVPNSRVIIVGTHADSDTLKRPEFEQIWEQLRTLLVSARDHHQQYFRKQDRLHDCLLCQSDSKCLRRSTGEGPTGFVNLGFDDTTSLEDETSFNEGSARIVSFPHIVGYYEVSSVKAMGNSSIFQVTSNKSIEHLKDAIVEIGRKQILNNPEIPRKWANVLESLQNHAQMDPEEKSVTSLEDVAKIARAQGVTGQMELNNMLHFLKAQGSLLFFPESDELKDLVVLDPEWLAKIFASVVSFRDTGISNEGFIDREKLKSTYKYVNRDILERILSLLHYFGVCIPIDGTNMELFPSKLPMGEPDDSIWPTLPDSNVKQVTYSVTFPSLIPPPLFSDLIVAVYRKRVGSYTMDKHCSYFSNQLLDCLKLDSIGCRDCGLNDNAANADAELVHQVLFELIAHRRTIYVTTRGKHPCCMIKIMNRFMNNVIRKYEGLGVVEFDTIICPGCFIQKSKDAHRFSGKLLLTDSASNDKLTCSNGHILPTPSGILLGNIRESCMSYATIRPKTHRDMMDYSGCPKLFIMLPVNKDGVSFDNELKLFASSLLFDGYSVHMLCEFPDGYHITRAPGFRLKKPKDFMKIYGNHVIAILRMLSHMVQSSVISLEYSGQNKSISRIIDDVVKDYRTKFPTVSDVSPEVTPMDLVAQIFQRGEGFDRDTLKKLLHVVDKPDAFGPLRRLRYYDQTLWLCNEHYRQLKVLQGGLGGVTDEAGSLA